MHLYHIPAGDDIPRAKMLQQYAATHTDLLRIDLHQIPGVLHSPVFRLANGPWPFSQFSPRLPQQGRPGRFVKHPAPLPIDQDASHHGGGDAALLAGEEHNQLVLAPTRILPAQRQNAFGQRRCPSGLAHAARPMRALFQGRHVVAVEAPLPAIKCLSADRETAAGPRRISSIEVIEQHPLQPPLRCPAQALPEARQLARLGKVTPSNLAHPDTLQSVTNHSGRAQHCCYGSSLRRVDYFQLASYSSAVLFRVLASHLAAKIRLDFCFARVSRPIGWCSPPKNILQVQPCTAFDEKPDYCIMAAPGSLVQRGRVGMASHRVVSVWIFARVKQQSNDLDMTKIRRQSECQMPVLTAGPRKESTCIVNAPQGRCHRQIDSSAARDQGAHGLELAVQSRRLYSAFGIRSVIAEKID